jgi:hypothetical protein
MNRHLEEISADPSYCTLVAESDGPVLGMAGLHRVLQAVRDLLRRLALLLGGRAEAVGYRDPGAAIAVLCHADLLHEQLH